MNMSNPLKADYNSLKIGQPFFKISLIFASICFWIFGGQSSATYPFSFVARFDLSSSSSGRFPISWRRKVFCLSSNFCIFRNTTCNVGQWSNLCLWQAPFWPTKNRTFWNLQQLDKKMDSIFIRTAAAFIFWHSP